MDISADLAKSMVLSEADALELFAFLIASARIQMDEPSQYASMRLLTAAENLREFVKEHVSSDTQKLFDKTVDLTTHAQIHMADTEGYSDTLDELCGMVAQYLLKQSGLEKGKS